MAELIVVAGPAGAGKTTWAIAEAERTGYGIASCDTFLEYHRDARPHLMAARLAEDFKAWPVIILEGCEALRTVSKMSLAKLVTKVVWIDGPEKPGTAGLTTQQKIHLRRLQGRIPVVEVVKRNA